jgi:hypothetical protein
MTKDERIQALCISLASFIAEIDTSSIKVATYLEQRLRPILSEVSNDLLDQVGNDGRKLLEPSALPPGDVVNPVDCRHGNSESECWVCADSRADETIQKLRDSLISSRETLLDCHRALRSLKPYQAMLVAELEEAFKKIDEILSGTCGGPRSEI